MPSGSRHHWSRFVRISKPYLTSESRRQAFGLLAALFSLLLTICALNVAISFVGRDFMTALAQRQPQELLKIALVYLGVFALSAIVGAFARYAELLCGLKWRAWLTQHLFNRYLSDQSYLRLNAKSEVDNPDERMADDVKAFTTTTLAFLVMFTNATITIIAFVGVLWSITPWLLLAGIVYPLIGTSITIFIGRRLVNLNHLQLKKEGDFRYELVQIRAHAETIAQEHTEEKSKSLLADRLGALVKNYRSIIRVLRNLQFIGGGYNYLSQLIPIFIVAPLYLRGEVEFGVVTQASMAFSLIFNAFSLVAEKFQDISAFAAVIGRVGVLEEAIAVREK